MKYLMIESDGTARQETSISDDDKAACADGDLNIFRLELDRFESASVEIVGEEEEPQFITTWYAV